MFPNQGGQWSPQPPPANAQYTPRPNQQNPQIPPISQAVPQGVPAMQTLQPQHPDQYRALPPPPSMYPPYHQQPQMGYPPAQPAPRQRTAIACRYCRRRKIRCSGFDQSEDGRCTNCQRFSQECVFTPVSAQTQAFVPAHTVWRGQQPPANTQLYGAYGQPLPPHGRGEQYQQSPQQPGQYPPPPQGYQQPPPMYGQPPPPGGQVPQQQTPGEAGRKRPTDEPHTPTLPPPNPALQGRVGEAPPGYAYPDPTGMNPGGASYYPPPAPHHHHPSHPPAPPHYQPQMQPHAYPPHLMPPQPPQGYPAAYGPHPTQHSVEPNVHLRASRSVPAMVATKRQEMIRNKNASPSAASNARQDERSPTDDTMVSALSRGVDRR